MKLEVLPDASTAARVAASFIAGKARQAIAERGRFIVALSGGSTPRQMLRVLASESIPWKHFYVVQVDERVAPAGDSNRNFTNLQQCFLSQTSIMPEQVYAMPVEADDLSEAAALYAQTLRQLAGSPPVLDLVHLGLGTDGHTASLVPGDEALEIHDRDVALTGVYQGHKRMTLTFPMLNRARDILWLVTGTSKAEVLQRLCCRDLAVPASRIRQDNARIAADRAAAAGVL